MIAQTPCATLNWAATRTRPPEAKALEPAGVSQSPRVVMHPDRWSLLGCFWCPAWGTSAPDKPFDEAATVRRHVLVCFIKLVHVIDVPSEACEVPDAL